MTANNASLSENPKNIYMACIKVIISIIKQLLQTIYNISSNGKIIPASTKPLLKHI